LNGPFEAIVRIRRVANKPTVENFVKWQSSAFRRLSPKAATGQKRPSIQPAALSFEWPLNSESCPTTYAKSAGTVAGMKPEIIGEGRFGKKAGFTLYTASPT